MNPGDAYNGIHIILRLTDCVCLSVRLSVCMSPTHTRVRYEHQMSQTVTVRVPHCCSRKCSNLPLLYISIILNLFVRPVTLPHRNNPARIPRRHQTAAPITSPRKIILESPAVRIEVLFCPYRGSHAISAGYRVEDQGEICLRVCLRVSMREERFAVPPQGFGICS